MERKNLIKNYKKFVHPGKKSLSDVFNEVSAKLDFQPQKLTILTGYFVKTQIHNAVQNIRNRITPYQTQVKLQLYELIQNEKSAPYYRYHSKNDFWPSENESILLLMDMDSEYVMSNSNRLYLEMFLRQGITEEDNQNDTVLLLMYLHNLECYLNEFAEDKTAGFVPLV